MKRSGYADLPLHHGRVPVWLAERMSRLGGAIAECLVEDWAELAIIFHEGAYESGERNPGKIKEN